MCLGSLCLLLGGIAACKYCKLEYWVKGRLAVSDACDVFQDRCPACRESLDFAFQPRSLHICPNQISQPDVDADDDDDGGEKRQTINHNYNHQASTKS